MDSFSNEMNNKSRQYHILVYFWDRLELDSIPTRNDQTTATWDILCTTTMDANIGAMYQIHIRDPSNLKAVRSTFRH